MAVPEWTDPTTFVVGHIETADELNVVLRDNMNFLHAAKGASVYRSGSNQTISNNTLTSILFNAELYDPWALHNPSSNTDRLTVPSSLAGVWRFTASGLFVFNASGYREFNISKNGSIVATRFRAPLASPNSVSGNVTVLLPMVANDYVQFQVRQTSGISLDIVFGAENTAFEADFLGSLAS
jgi:hypothetical protein